MRSILGAIGAGLFTYGTVAAATSPTNLSAIVVSIGVVLGTYAFFSSDAWS
jgi:hypothetical protein